MSNKLGELARNLLDVIKGGSGSGNWGHDGQEGSWGGSSETGGTSEAFLKHPGELRHSFNPDTGEYDEERHNDYVSSLDEAHAKEYEEKIEEYKEAGLHEQEGETGYTELIAEGEREVIEEGILSKRDREIRREFSLRISESAIDEHESFFGDQPDVTEVDDPELYYDAVSLAKERNEYGQFVDAGSVESLSEKRMFLYAGGEAGFAVGEDGNITNVFKNPDFTKRKGTVYEMLSQAVDKGGDRLDNYDGALTTFYAQSGFQPEARLEFNREFAPDDWNYERDGEPDIMFSRHVESELSGEEMRDRILSGVYEENITTEGLPYADDYMEGKEMQEAGNKMEEIREKIKDNSTNKNNSINKFIDVLKGGEGSGNWGHDGQAGSWGGSSETGGASAEFTKLPGELRHSFDPDSGQFDKERHLEYCDTLTTEEYNEYMKELYEEVEKNEQLEKGDMRSLNKFMTGEYLRENSRKFDELNDKINEEVGSEKFEKAQRIVDNQGLTEKRGFRDLALKKERDDIYEENRVEFLNAVVDDPDSYETPVTEMLDDELRDNVLTAEQFDVYEKVGGIYHDDYRMKSIGSEEYDNILNEELDKLDDPEVKEAVMDKYEENMKIIGEGEVKTALEKWSATSGDKDPEAIAMQIAIAKEFDMEAKLDHFPAREKQDAYSIHRIVGDGNRDIARSIYDETQERLEEAGIDEVIAFRGMSVDETIVEELEHLEPEEYGDRAGNILDAEIQQVDYASQPLSSFSTDPVVGFEFADGYAGGRKQLLLATAVPKEQVFSLHGTGQGCHYEKELTVIGEAHKGDAIYWDGQGTFDDSGHQITTFTEHDVELKEGRLDKSIAGLGYYDEGAISELQEYKEYSPEEIKEAKPEIKEKLQEVRGEDYSEEYAERFYSDIESYVDMKDKFVGDDLRDKFAPGSTVDKSLSDSFINVIKGGEGSGNWGHDGQGGSWGGSSETGGTSEEFLELDPDLRHSFDPNSAEFHEHRYLKYCEDMEQEEYNEYKEKIAEEIGGEQLEKLPDVPNPQPGDFKTSTQAEKWMNDKYNILADFTTPIYELHEDTKGKLIEERGVDSWADIDDMEKIDLDMDMVNENLGQFEKMAEDYPFVAEKLEYFGTGRDMNLAHYATASKDGTSIELNPRHYADKDVMIEHIAEDSESGFHPDIEEEFYPVATVTHEFGHQIYNSLTEFGDSFEKGEFIGRYASELTILDGEDFGGKIRDNSYATLSEEQLPNYHIPDMVEYVTKQHHQSDAMDIENTLSGYSKYSHLETFAENYLASECGTEEQKQAPSVRSFDDMMERVQNYYTEDEVTSYWEKAGEITDDPIQRDYEMGKLLYNDTEHSVYNELISEYEPEDTANKFLEVVKGGQGSGNWGHDGQAGSWGGSSETGGTSEAFLEIDPEYRHSFDPETGEYDPVRHEEYSDHLYETEGPIVAGEYEDEIDRILMEQKYGDGVEPSNFVDENGIIDVEEARKATEGMTMEEKFEKRLEIVEASLESREQHAKERRYEIMDRVESVEISYEKSSLFEDMPQLADDDDFEEDEIILEIDGRKEIVTEETEAEIMHHLEELEKKETLGEQQRYLDEEVVIPDLNFADPEDQIDMDTRGGRNFIKETIGNRIDKQLIDAYDDDQPEILDDFGDINPYLVEQDNPANLPVLVNEEMIVHIYGDDYPDPEAVAERFSEEVNKGKEFIEKHANGEYNELIMPMDVYPTKGRGTYDRKGRNINVGLGGDMDETAVHELSHALHHENSVERMEAIEHFFDKRTEGETPTLIHEDSQGNQEWGYKDHFIDHYTGKVYNFDEYRGTEVLSTGMEALYKDPERFRQQDEEHFKLTVACLEGLF